MLLLLFLYYMQRRTNVEVEKTDNESTLALLRRFSKRVQGSGILNRVRGKRYQTRTQSRLKRKVSALKLLEKRAEQGRLAKLGKLQEKS